MRKGGGYWKWHLVVLVQLLLALRGVELQQTPSPQQQGKAQMKPQIYWATSVDSTSNNRRFQQNDWSAVPATNNYHDRTWIVPGKFLAENLPPPTPPAPPAPPAPDTTVAAPPTTVAPPAPAPPAPAPPAPAPSYWAPPTYAAPAPSSYWAPPPSNPAPAPPSYAPPPSYPAPAPPSYPAPAPPAYQDPNPAPPPYSPPPYDPAPQPSYDARVPSYGAPPSPSGNYYYYYPVKQVTKGPTFADLIDKDKQALAAMLPSKLSSMAPLKLDPLTYSQKVWLSILSPIIIVAFVIPLAAILLSGK